MIKRKNTPEDCSLNPTNSASRLYKEKATTTAGTVVLIVQHLKFATQPPAHLSDVGSLTLSHNIPNRIKVLKEEEKAYLNSILTYDSDSI